MQTKSRQPGTCCCRLASVDSRPVPLHHRRDWAALCCLCMQVPHETSKHAVRDAHFVTASSTPGLGGSTRLMSPMNTKPSVGGPWPSTWNESVLRARIFL
eukprot:GHRR01032225.1.p3 GENE.GHRR01032225.1~~GHRR01032225.1.p3  ORF type:complete len:100 (-),score=7.42 GHRR01032225.1:757-1056(-)